MRKQNLFKQVAKAVLKSRKTSPKSKPNITESIFKPYRKRIVYHEDITNPTIDEWTKVIED